MPSPKTWTEFAPAKVNLTLHVTGQRDDGYHLLDSLVVFANAGDVLELREGAAMLEITGPFAPGVPTGRENTILKAAELLGLEAAFSLTKNLPHPAGIGGGSADAAAAVRGLCGMAGRDLPAAQDLLPLGADMPVCLCNTPQRMTGVGEHVEPVKSLQPMWLVLVNPGVPTPTGPIFHALETKTNPAMGEVPDFPSLGAQVAWLRSQRNDLQLPAIDLCPEVDEALIALEASGALLARMSGSGATCFGIFASQAAADRAAKAINRPDWWVVAAEVLQRTRATT